MFGRVKGFLGHARRKLLIFVRFFLIIVARVLFHLAPPPPPHHNTQNKGAGAISSKKSWMKLLERHMQTFQSLKAQHSIC